LKASRNAGAVATVSALALIVLKPIFASLDQKAETDQAPAHEDDLAPTSVPVQPNDWLERLGSHIVGLPEIRNGRTMHVEVFGNALLI
jgi:hypothetical protein